MVKRQLIKVLKKYAKKYPILTLTGPRQSGKTTLLKSLFKEYRYVSLENQDNRQFALQDPNGFLEEYDKFVILDEVQQAPVLFSYIQTKVDEDAIMGQYILSGSQNFYLLENITQSLAGRTIILKLLPFDFSELKQADLLPKDYTESILKGFYPAIYDRNITPDVYYSNYIQTYVERDITTLRNVHNLRQFKDFLSICATRASQLLNINDMARDAGISHTTAKKWLSLLETSYILFLLPPYFNNFSKRIVKSPKLYFYDTGLLSYLLNIKSPTALKKQSLKGHLFENMIVSEYVKQNQHKNLLLDLYFWRDSKGHEIDLIFEDDKGFNAVEIKASTTIKYDFFKNLNYFKSISKDLEINETLIYAGLKDTKRNSIQINSWINAFQ